MVVFFIYMLLNDYTVQIYFKLPFFKRIYIKGELYSKLKECTVWKIETLIFFKVILTIKGQIVEAKNARTSFLGQVVHDQNMQNVVFINIMRKNCWAYLFYFRMPIFPPPKKKKCWYLKEYSLILIASFYDINQQILRKKGYSQNFSWF